MPIREIVSQAIDAAGGLPAGVLIKTTSPARDPDNPSQREAAAETRYALQAVVETKEVRSEGVVVGTRLVMTIIGGSIVPLTVPAVNDRVEIAGIVYTLAELLLADPAEATFQFAVS